MKDEETGGANGAGQEGGDSPATGNSDASRKDDRQRIALTLPELQKKAIEALAAVNKCEYADVLMTRTIPQAVKEYEKLKALFN